MAYWNSQQQEIVYFKPRDVPEYPGWQEVDCGCCAGIEWGGDVPRECRDCGGSGRQFLHVKSRVLAEYPGGPFTGRLEASRPQ